MNILAVCEGNVARSQFLEAIITYWIKYISFSDSVDFVRSVGIDPDTPDKYVHPIREVSDIVLENLGMKWEPKYHTVDQVKEEDMEWADVVFVLYDTEKARKKYGESKEFQMLEKSAKVIYIKGIRDPHSGRIEEIDLNVIGSKLGAAFVEIYKKTELLFPRDHMKQEKALRELETIATLEKEIPYDRKTQYEEYIRYKNELYVSRLGIPIAEMAAAILPEGIRDAPPTSFKKNDLDSYENRLSLMVLLYSCQPDLVKAILGKNAYEWMQEQRTRYGNP